MNELMIPADRDHRKKVVIWAVLFALVGAFSVLALYATFMGLESLAEADPEKALQKLKKILTVITVLNAFASSLFAIYFTSVAARIIKSGQYPPPGMRVLRDTKLRTGKAAKWMAVPQILAAVLILATNIAMGLLQRVVEGMAG